MESGNQRGKYRRRVVCKYHFMNDLLGSDDSRCLTSHHFRDCGRSERLVIRGRRRELGLGAVALPRPSGNASTRCWSGPLQWPCETTTRATGRTGRRARGMAFWRTAGELEVANRLVEGVLIMHRQDAASLPVQHEREDDVGELRAPLPGDAELEELGSGSIGFQLYLQAARESVVLAPHAEPFHQERARHLGLDQVLMLCGALAHRPGGRGPSRGCRERRIEPWTACERLRRPVR